MKRFFASFVIVSFMLLTLVFGFQNCSGNSHSTNSVTAAAVPSASPTMPQQIVFSAPLIQQATSLNSTGISPVGITSGQFNSSGGANDLLVSGSGGLYYFTNTGGGTFAVNGVTPLAIAGLTQPGALATGQFGIASGFQGVAAVDTSSNNLMIIPGNGDGTFNAAAAYTSPVAANANFVVPFDLNGDTYLDAQVLSPASSRLTSVASTFNAATNSVSYSSTITNLGSGAAMVVADVNGDGLLDVLTYSNGNLNIFLANAAGFNAALTIAVPFVGGSSIGQISVGDLDRDGLPDIAAYTNSYQPTAGNYAIDAHYFKNVGGGQFAYVRNDTYTVGPNFSYTGSAIQDINGDGFNDLALVVSFGVTASPTSYIMLKTCSQTSIPFNFTCVDNIATLQGGAATAMTIADVNADGRKDVVVTGSQDAVAGNGSIYVFLDSN